MRSLIASLVLFSFSAAASAQEPVAKKKQEGQEPPSAKPRQAEDVVIQERKALETAPPIAEAERRLGQTPGGVNLVDGEDLRRGRDLLPSDTFQWAPGVYVQSRFGAEESRMSIRGSGLQRTFHGRGLMVMQDNVPINLADGGFDMQALEPMAARYVEVWRGGNALKFGSTTLGGAINYVSPTGRDASPALGRFETGSFGYLRGQAATAFADGAADFYATVTAFESDGYRDHADQSNQRLFTNLGYQLSPDVETRVYVTYAESDSELPGSYTKAVMRNDPERANPSNVTGDQKRDFDLIRIADKTTFRLGSEARIDAGLGYCHKYLFHPIFQVIDQTSDDVTAHVSYTNESDWFGSKNIFTLGFLPTYGVTDDKRYNNIGGHTGAEVANNDLTAMSLAFFVEEQHYLTPQFAVVAGFQAVWTQLDLEDDFVTGANLDQSDDETYSGINPKVGVRYELNERAQIFANVSRSFEPPSFSELLNSTTATGIVFTDEQTAWTFELGTRGHEGIVAWDLALYWARIEDELLSYQNPLVPSQTFTINADRTVHRGVEAGFDVTVWEEPKLHPKDRSASTRVVLRQTYLWSYFRFDDDDVYGSNAIAGMPEHLYRAEIRFEHEAGLYVAPNLEWAGSWVIDHANTFEASGYVTYGLQLGYRAHKFTIFLDVRNLADRIYSPTTGVVANANGADSAVFNAADERSFYTGVEYHW